jgi:hypothetical protein
MRVQHARASGSGLVGRRWAAGAAAYFMPAFRKSITVDHAGVYGTGFCTEQSAPEVERIVAAARTPSSVR